MKAYVSSITPHHAGFGQYQRGETVAVDGDWDSVDDYAGTVVQSNNLIRSYAIDPDVAEMGDADGEELAAALREATGAVLGGHDTLVAYHMGYGPDGRPEIIIESIELE